MEGKGKSPEQVREILADEALAETLWTPLSYTLLPVSGALSPSSALRASLTFTRQGVLSLTDRWEKGSQGWDKGHGRGLPSWKRF